MTTERTYKMGTASRMTGISPELLRAWEQRYGLLQPIRTAGGHRLYTDEDIRLLRHVRAQMAEGHSIGDVARQGRESVLRQAQLREVLVTDRFKASARTGSVLPSASVEGWIRQIVDGAVAVDGPAVDRAMDGAFAALGSLDVIHKVIEPAAREIGRLWAGGVCSIAGEHLTSTLFEHRLLSLLDAAQPTGSQDPPALVASFPDEPHSLGALTVANEIVRTGTPVSFLGAALPWLDLERAIELVGPPAVYLSVTRETTYDRHIAGLWPLVERFRDEVAFHVGGQGVPRAAAGGVAGLQLHPMRMVG